MNVKVVNLKTLGYSNTQTQLHTFIQTREKLNKGSELVELT